MNKWPFLRYSRDYQLKNIRIRENQIREELLGERMDKLFALFGFYGIIPIAFDWKGNIIDNFNVNPKTLSLE